MHQACRQQQTDNEGIDDQVCYAFLLLSHYRIRPTIISLALLAGTLAAPALAQISSRYDFVCRSDGSSQFFTFDLDKRKVEHEGRSADLIISEAYYQFTFPGADPFRIDRTTGAAHRWREASRTWATDKDWNCDRARPNRF
jgi:hypothetical protein